MNKDEFILYDRNIGLWGLENQQKLSKCTVLIYNITPCTVEVMKNLSLAGVNLQIFDNKSEVTNNDMNIHFFLTNEDIGKNKAICVQERIQKINRLVHINVVEYLPSETKIAIVDLVDSDNHIEIEKAFHNKETIIYYVNTFNSIGFFINNLILQQKETNLNKAEIPSQIEIIDDENEKESSLEKEGKIENNDEFINISDDEENENIKEKKDDIISLENFTFSLIKDKIITILEKQCHNISDKTFKKNILHISYLLYLINNIPNHNLNISPELQAIIETIHSFLNENRTNNLFICECVLAGIVSQEVVKSITLNEYLNTNVYCYDSYNQLGNFLNIV